METASEASQFKQVFERSPVLLPVVHVESLDQALRNAELARDEDCDGVFLINHGVSWQTLLEVHAAVSERVPSFWLGVNLLGMSPADVFAVVGDRVAGIWVDNAMIDERRDSQPAASAVAAARGITRWQGLYFGGVAFKYQRQVEDLERAARVAAKYMDVVTTSGPGTGQAAEVEKIGRMKKAIGSVPLAIASGITPENVGSYLGIADCFLVATGISRSWTEFDPARVRELVRRARGT